MTLSAWLQAIPIAIAASLLAIYGTAHFWRGVAFNQTTMDIGYGVIGACYGAFYVFMGFAPGENGPNCYGEADAPSEGAGRLRR